MKPCSVNYYEGQGHSAETSAGRFQSMQKFLNRLTSRSAAACPGQGLRSSSSPATKHRDNSDGSDSSRTDLPDPIPNQRIIQAWRVVTWPEGVYSIAKVRA